MRSAIVTVYMTSVLYKTPWAFCYFKCISSVLPHADHIGGKYLTKV